jgi:hypothetical protein
VLVAEHAEEYSIKINVPLPTIQQRNAIMPWLRVTRVSSDNPTEHDAVLLNTAHIISIEHVGGEAEGGGDALRDVRRHLMVS